MWQQLFFANNKIAYNEFVHTGSISDLLSPSAANLHDVDWWDIDLPGFWHGQSFFSQSRLNHCRGSLGFDVGFNGSQFEMSNEHVHKFPCVKVYSAYSSG